MRICRSKGHKEHSQICIKYKNSHDYPKTVQLATNHSRNAKCQLCKRWTKIQLNYQEIIYILRFLQKKSVEYFATKWLTTILLSPIRLMKENIFISSTRRAYCLWWQRLDLHSALQETLEHAHEEFSWLHYLQQPPLVPCYFQGAQRRFQAF